MELKDRIKKARKEAGFKSQAAFADYLGTTRDALAAYELGRVVPNDVFLQLMATKLNISFDWLHDGKGEKTLQASNSEEQVKNWVHGIFEQGSTFERRFVSALSKFEGDDWKVLERIIDKITAENEQSPAPADNALQEELAALDKRRAAIISQLSPPAPDEAKTHTVELSEEEYREVVRERTAREAEKDAVG